MKLKFGLDEHSSPLKTPEEGSLCSKYDALLLSEVRIEGQHLCVLLGVFAICNCKLAGVIKQSSYRLRQGRQLQIRSRCIKRDAFMLVPTEQ